MFAKPKIIFPQLNLWHMVDSIQNLRDIFEIKIGINKISIINYKCFHL